MAQGIHFRRGGLVRPLSMCRVPLPHPSGDKACAVDGGGESSTGGRDNWCWSTNGPRRQAPACATASLLPAGIQVPDVPGMHLGVVGKRLALVRGCGHAVDVNGVHVMAQQGPVTANRGTDCAGRLRPQHGPFPLKVEGTPSGRHTSRWAAFPAAALPMRARRLERLWKAAWS